ncbi:MAG: AfsR/SARP family transcriptional regulator [Thermocrispum sp.]
MPDQRAAGPGPAQLRLLGEFRLELSDVHIRLPASSQRLLAFLALRGPVARSAAAWTLWADVVETKALGSLRTAMWRANRRIPGVVVAEQSRLSLPAFLHVDVAESVTLATRLLSADRSDQGWEHGDLDGVAAVLQRAGADLLPGWYDDWVCAERERWRQLRVHALEAAAARWAVEGRHALALDVALEAVRCNPLRESAHRAVIAVHLAEGNLVEAMRSFQRYRDLLVAELGLQPSAELAAMVGHPRQVRLATEPFR